MPIRNQKEGGSPACGNGRAGRREMRIRKSFHTIDTHTEGEPTRTVVGGVPVVPGKTMKEKMVYMMERQDWIRKVLTYEPRGNDVMSGTILTPPCDAAADIGVLYFEVGGWMPMCGHDTSGSRRPGGSGAGGSNGTLHLHYFGHGGGPGAGKVDVKDMWRKG